MLAGVIYKRNVLDTMQKINMITTKVPRKITMSNMSMDKRV